eukprot:TRINITY_DN6105_c0_g1_i1.p1 TRINITY_DN6105_c0_g1~~TRINITY_DN6105_c0_g1_i1.p1  ORF type:complete len:279 (-),score=47.65 TRINITY_DN6105_c0_g1_i1:71-907(-)
MGGYLSCEQGPDPTTTFNRFGSGTGGFTAIRDRFKSLTEVQDALRSSGLESCNLIIGVDFTKSNTWTGKYSFGGLSLHHIDPKNFNPYQRVIDIIGRTLEVFDDDRLIPAYGFGDIYTTDKGVFSFYPDERPCVGVSEVLTRYSEITPNVQLSGPTSFAPLIYKAVEIVRHNKQYHILLIIADGQVTNEKDTKDAIVFASSFPLSIVMIGVGDGPWDMMEEFDDGLPTRRFDNFQFVNFNSVVNNRYTENMEVDFAVRALMEIPDQYQAIRKLGLLSM